MSNEEQARAYLAEAERNAWIVPGMADDIETLPVAKVGIIGAGTMGSGIAMCFANAGFAVVMVDAEREAVDRGLARIRKSYDSSAEKGRITAEDVQTRAGLIEGDTALESVADCDLVIEAVFEDMGVKKDIFGRLDGIAKPGAILATNTSALDIDEIATAVSRPEAVMGLHFFSPAHIMKLLEVVRADKTSDRVLATALELARTIRKQAVVVGVTPGFVGNRILFPRQMAAMRLVLEGPMPWEIDLVHTDFGMPMGPFAMADLAGLDIGWSKATSRGESLRDRLCEMGRFGQKNGKGYYDYDENRKAQPSPVVEDLVREFAEKSGIQRREVTDQEILERTVYPMINEGARLLEDGKATRASDIDVVWVYGFGWPATRGGPMYYADSVGLETIRSTLEAMAERTGVKALRPAPLLNRLAERGATFGSYQSG